MKTITSRTNDTVKKIGELHTSKGRSAQRAFIAEGIRVIATFLEHSFSLRQLYTTEHQRNAALALAPEHLITVVSDHVMEKISTAATASGLLAIFDIPQQPPHTALRAGIVLANITDPGNMGTLIRTTAAMGYTSVVLVEGCDPWSAKVIQASAGTLTQVSIWHYSWQELLRHKGDLPLCALVVNGGKDPDTLTSTNMLLVVGNEANGLPQEWINECQERMTIPMPGHTESLNAAVAGSIAIYLMKTKATN